jgi:hypothetical protein
MTRAANTTPLDPKAVQRAIDIMASLPLSPRRHDERRSRSLPTSLPIFARDTAR